MFCIFQTIENTKCGNNAYIVRYVLSNGMCSTFSEFDGVDISSNYTVYILFAFCYKPNNIPILKMW